MLEEERYALAVVCTPTGLGKLWIIRYGANDPVNYLQLD